MLDFVRTGSKLSYFGECVTSADGQKICTTDKPKVTCSVIGTKRVCSTQSAEQKVRSYKAAGGDVAARRKIAAKSNKMAAEKAAYENPVVPELEVPEVPEEVDTSSGGFGKYLLPIGIGVVLILGGVLIIPRIIKKKKLDRGES